jgi:hypothetical protein
MQLDIRLARNFNPRPIQSAADKARKKALYRVGAYGRRVVRRGMRKRKKAASPGSPPSVHKGGLKRSIVFEVNEIEGTVRVGPRRTSENPTNRGANIHETGGVTKIKPRVISTKKHLGKWGYLRIMQGAPWKGAGWAFLATRAQVKRAVEIAKAINEVRQSKGRWVRAWYPKRPYLEPAKEPAIEAFKAKFPELFRELMRLQGG